MRSMKFVYLVGVAAAATVVTLAAQTGGQTAGQTPAQGRFLEEFRQCCEHLVGITGIDEESGFAVDDDFRIPAHARRASIRALMRSRAVSQTK